MSFVTLTRDYIELLTNFSFRSTLSITELLKENILFVLQTVQSLFFYIISFRWIRDFTFLPITAPQISLSLLKEKLFFEDSGTTLFQFLDIPAFRQNTLLLGFVNSFALTLPISAVHIIAVRRLYIQGIPLAAATISGYLLGQLAFIACVIFGFRTVIMAWFSLEPLNYIIGVVVVFQIVYSMALEDDFAHKDWRRPNVTEFFFISLLLAWCEQTTLFQYLGNLNFQATTSALEATRHSTFLISIAEHLNYITGLIVGSIFFTICWGVFILFLLEQLFLSVKFYIQNFTEVFNKVTFVFLVALSLCSIPFYALEYLTTAPLGFVSQDKVFYKTWFAENFLKDFSRVYSTVTKNKSLEMDVSMFDRGRYTLFPEITDNKEGFFSYEDLNYHGERHWMSRLQKVSWFTKKSARLGRAIRQKFFKYYRKYLVTLDPRDFPIKTQFFRKQYPVPQDEPIIGESDLLGELTQERLKVWYTDAKLDTKQMDEKEQDFARVDKLFREAKKETFSKNFLTLTYPDRPALAKRLKRRYYTNWIYKALLNIDIDLLLNRQPRVFRLNTDQELDLYTKRELLVSYYDSLRDYENLPYFDAFEDFFDGTKSFSQKVYNQQFKGTLRSVCRLFSLTMDDEFLKNTNEIVLKYDQPLYILPGKNLFSPYHEELKQPEETNSSPFLEMNTIGPVYAGWNAKTRKFVVTNKLLPRKLAGYKINIPQKSAKKFVQKREFLVDPNQTTLKEKIQTKLPNLMKSDKKTENQPKNQFQIWSLNKRKAAAGSLKIRFTTWPVNLQILNSGKSNSWIPFTTLYTPSPEFEADKKENYKNLDELPANWQILNRKVVVDVSNFYYLAPQRGGFIWPGTERVKMFFDFIIPRTMSKTS